jgi:imidazole glycerol-phosphate synthase subunit HisH
VSVDIAVIDYGMGNLRSVSKAIEHVAPAASVVVTSDPAVIAEAGRVVFPGQGAAPDCMREIDARGLRQVIIDAARSKPFLGICMGMQVLFEHSEEGDTPCLGILPGTVQHFPHEAMHDDARATSSRCRTWAGTTSIRQCRIRCGWGSRKARASTSSTAISCSRPRPT